ncbi:MAG: hypothetical protein QOJ60_1062 [Actinomycetota bacterium]|jgi:uncharacterized membrane protein YhaH (DUF805 family)|nr:hypothetical protein [Actinomycetota bacterium]
MSSLFSTRPRAVITAAVVLAVMEVLSSISIAVESYADAEPLFAVLFAGLFLVAALLARRGHLTSAAALLAVLCLFEIVSAPTWTRHNAYDAVSDVVAVALSVGGLVVAVRSLVPPRRTSVSA